MKERDDRERAQKDLPSSFAEAKTSKIDSAMTSKTDDAKASHSSSPDVFEDQRAAPSAIRRTRRNVAIVAIVALLVSTLIAILIARRAKTTAGTDEAESKPTVSVRVAKAERTTIAAEVSALGTITPLQQATVSPKISAQIKQMALLKNKYVRAGDVIAVLEASDLQAQRREAVAALQEAQHTARSLTAGTIPQQNAQAERDLRDARANVANARALYERRRALYAQGGIALKEVEAAQLALTNAEDNLRLMERTVALRAEAINPNDRAAAEARVSQAQDRIKSLDVQISYATIRAPISGIVTDQFQFQGEYASAGAKLVNIADMSEVIVKAPFADEIAAQLKTGDAAEVIPTDAPDEVMHGQVSLISRSADPQNRTSEVWVRLGNASGKLKPNGAAQVRITAQEHQDAVVVPVAAVTLEASNGHKGTVMTVDEANVAHETKVTTGIRADDKIEIVEGLKGGETIVVEGNYALPDGTKVEPQENEDNGDEDEKKGADKKDEKSDQAGAEKDVKGDEKKGDEE